MKRLNTLGILVVALLVALFLPTCSFESSKKENFALSGSIDYLGDAEFFVERQPIHYKYAPKIKIPFIPNEDGTFGFSLKTDSTELIWLSLGDNNFPIAAENGKTINLDIKRASFPEGLIISPDENSIYNSYFDYLEESKGLESKISAEMRKLRDGEPNEALELSRERVRLASKYLDGTPLESIRLKTLGEHYVNEIRAIEYWFGQPGFDADAARKEVLTKAKNEGLFTLEALKAQRAGIRDITHYYARTFGIYEKVTESYGKHVAEADIKRVAYPELNEKREEVLEYITDKKAKAYAEMHLVAERIGEIPLTEATPSYDRFLTDYRDYPEYTKFLTRFYNEVKAVAPGAPAVPFSLKDKDGNTFSMADFQGKYVLLDFWAGWCQPCLDEFADMNRLYKKYSRNDFEIIAISTELDRDVWLQDIEKFKNPWPQLYGGNGFEQEAFMKYRGGGIPFYILIDRNGNIIRYNDIRATFNLEEVMDNFLK